MPCPESCGQSCQVSSALALQRLCSPAAVARHTVRRGAAAQRGCPSTPVPASRAQLTAVRHGAQIGSTWMAALLWKCATTYPGCALSSGSAPAGSSLLGSSSVLNTTCLTPACAHGRAASRSRQVAADRVSARARPATAGSRFRYCSWPGRLHNTVAPGPALGRQHIPPWQRPLHSCPAGSRSPG